MYLDRRADRHLQLDSWAVRQLGSVQFYSRAARQCAVLC
jgi:hypothetical protein